MYTYRHQNPYKAYREARVFSKEELLLMDFKAMILFGESAKDWWKRLSPEEKYQILFSEKPSSYVDEIHGNTCMVQEL